MKPAFGDPLPIVPRRRRWPFSSGGARPRRWRCRRPDRRRANSQRLLGVAARAPDHGKLNPWRFVVLQGEAKAAFVAGLERVAAARPDAVKATAKLGKIRVPPLTIAVISRLVPGEIDPWEQELSAGAVCALMIVAAQAMGYGANWITDWYAYDGAAKRLLGLAADERVAGFIHIGTAAEPPLERVRPDMAQIVTAWAPRG